MQQHRFCEDLNSESSDSGFIVISTNEFYPSCVIIDTTHKLPNKPVVESSRNQFAPFLFVVHWSRFVPNNLRSVEKTIRKELCQFKNKKMTHFNLTIQEAIKKLDSIVDNLLFFTWGKIHYRKIQDARWGAFFEQLNIPFLYITTPFKITDSDSFMPDFWLRDQKYFLIVGKNFSEVAGGKRMAYRFAKEKDKVIFRFWDCRPGLEYDHEGEQRYYFGSYVTPEGDSDGTVEWGICKKCSSRHIGHFGSPELCDAANRNTSKTNCQCHTDGENEELIKAYKNVQSFLGSHD